MACSGNQLPELGELAAWQDMEGVEVATTTLVEAVFLLVRFSLVVVQNQYLLEQSVEALKQSGC